jgi:N-hydroxyarylamine O-acetyltransferase
MSGPTNSDEFDLEAYLARIGLSGQPALRDVHRAHVTAIPFENLDAHRGVPVSLALADLQRKLVVERRGGYCFEQNLVLKAALEALGAQVEVMLARVRQGSAPGAVRPRTHLLLRVRADGTSWHADVGFGPTTLQEPIPFGPREVQNQSGWRFRVIQDGPEYVLQTATGQIAAGVGWADLYGFVPEPVPQVDLETSNWFTCTHPRSPFVTGLNVSLLAADGTRTSLSDWSGQLALVEETPARRTVTPIGREEIPRLLADRFGLAGFSLGDGGRIIAPGAGVDAGEIGGASGA